MSKDEEVMIDPGTSLLVETLEKRWQTYLSELKGCKKEPTEEAIHALRVATRRLLALIDMLREFSPHARLKKLRRTFKNQLDSLDDLRDTQVMLIEVSERIHALPDLVSFQAHLNKREKRLLRTAAKAIKSVKSGNSRERVDATRKALFKLESGVDRQKALLEIVDNSYNSALRRYQRVEPTQVATIHRVRVAFKKFRYMLEIIHPLVPDFPENNFKTMHEYQGMMGEIQDMEVFNSVFDEFVKKDVSYNPAPIRQYYQNRHTEAVNAYLTAMNQFNSFWRSESGSPFPWETSKKKAAEGKLSSAPKVGLEKDENGKQAEGAQDA